MATTFKHEQMFPIIARIIQTATQGAEKFIARDEIALALTKDPDGAPLVQAAAGMQKAEKFVVAGNMVDFFSATMTENKNPWAEVMQRERPGKWEYRYHDPASPVKPAPALALGDDYEAYEGNKMLVRHIKTERNPHLREIKLASAVKAGKLTCEACGDDLSEKYFGLFPGAKLGESVKTLLEVHHKQWLSKTGEVLNNVNALALLCPTCHRAIHRDPEMLAVEEFREKYFA